MTITLLARLHAGGTDTKLWNYTVEDIVTGITQEFSDAARCLAVKHRGKKKETPHYHIVFQYIGEEFEDLKLTDFTSRFKEAFNKGSGNAHHSIKFGDGDDKCYSYLFHENAGSDCVLYQHGHTPNEIKEFIELNEQVQSEWETPSQLCKAIAHEIMTDSKRRSHDHQSIARLVWKYYSQQDKNKFFPNRAQMDRYIYRIYATISSEEESFKFYYNNNFK